MKPTVGSLFTGIGGFDLGLERAGWQVAWQVENNDFRRKILKRHWPQVELRNDIRTDTDGLRRVDLICGGFPCQDLSVAGNRAGLDGERSGLWYEYLRVVREIRPTWVLIENVPGLISSHEGKDFEIVITGLTTVGYGMAWRVLDSQYFGVAQRRHRVFIVGYLGAPCPLEILFEPESLQGDTPPIRKARKEVAGTLGGRSTGGGWNDDLDRAGAFIPEVSRTITSREYRLSGEDTETYVVNARQDPIVGKQPLDRNGNSLAIALEDVAGTVRETSGKSTGNSRPIPSNLVVSAETDTDRVREATGVPGRVDSPDGPRYAALGDAVTVPVIKWIGRRILEWQG